MKAKPDLQAITIADLESAYSGRDGKCCCGCAGKHYYVGAEAEKCEKRCGTLDEKQVLRILRLVQSGGDEADYGGNNFAHVIGKRLYVVYLKDRTIGDAIDVKRAQAETEVRS